MLRGDINQWATQKFMAEKNLDAIRRAQFIARREFAKAARDYIQKNGYSPVATEFKKTYPWMGAGTSKRTRKPGPSGIRKPHNDTTTNYLIRSKTNG